VKNADTCARVEVPANGFLDSTGRAWRCERGFFATTTACEPLSVPANAHITYSGNEWACHDGYRKESSACIARAVGSPGF
jgi:hypothetical protein